MTNELVLKDKDWERAAVKAVKEGAPVPPFLIKDTRDMAADTSSSLRTEIQALAERYTYVVDHNENNVARLRQQLALAEQDLATAQRDLSAVHFVLSKIQESEQ